MAEHLNDNGIEVFCHGIARIEVLGSVRRVIFTTPEVSYPGYQNVVVKLVMTAELLSTLAHLAAGVDRGTIAPELLALETTKAN